ncbi:MAG: hypothetical protein E7518_09460 [Ruminococcaceae bacterium]|nr:hypothetical protein [Oscillospiraceae bacterium]HHV31884.1 hypothetical protein [Clostridiales bacterium]
MCPINVTGGELPQAEIDRYVEYLQDKNAGRTLQYVNIEVDGDYVNLTYELTPVPFERIRRITGYLVGTIDRWNDAKRAEERDRVKHGLTMADSTMK